MGSAFGSAFRQLLDWKAPRKYCISKYALQFNAFSISTPSFFISTSIFTRKLHCLTFLRMSKSIATSDEKEKQTKASWDDDTVDSFIHVCVKETLHGNRPHGHFTKVGWRNVVKNFYEKTGRNYGYNQLKNKWTILKKDWNLWNDLVGGEKELEWDSLTRTIEATSQWWDNKLKTLPEAAKFREKRLQNVELLNILFKDAAVKGGAWSPIPTQVVFSKPSSDKIQDYYDDTIEDTKFNVNEINTSVTYTKQSEKRRKKVDSKVGSLRLFDALDRLCDAIEYRRRDLTGCSTLEVMETLRGLPGIVEGDELYMKATDILIKRENREMFVALKKPEIQIIWLRQKRVWH